MGIKVSISIEDLRSMLSEEVRRGIYSGDVERHRRLTGLLIDAESATSQDTATSQGTATSQDTFVYEGLGGRSRVKAVKAVRDAPMSLSDERSERFFQSIRRGKYEPGDIKISLRDSLSWIDHCVGEEIPREVAEYLGDYVSIRRV